MREGSCRLRVNIAVGRVPCRVVAPPWWRRAALACALLPLAAGDVRADGRERVYLVRDGRPAAAVSHGSQDTATAMRLRARLREWTGALIRQSDLQEPVPSGFTEILIGSPESHPRIAESLSGHDLKTTLGAEGFLIRAARADAGGTVILAGATRLGAINATAECLSWQLRIDGGSAWLDAGEVTARPAMPMRMMWSSTGGANWHPDFDRFHAGQGPALAAAITDEATYLEHTRRLTDFMSEHKLNGLIFFGLAGSRSGGVDAARKMTRYAKESGVRVLPLIGTGTYSGFYDGEHPFNIGTWAKTHPEARCRKQDDAYYEDSITPCHPEAVKFFKEGAEWLFTTLPDIGGVNLENGDWMSCWNPECAAEKEKPENDPNFYWDMMASQRDIIEIGLRHQPDAWMTFATYTPFTEPLIRRDMGRAITQKLAKGITYPPRFLDQVDPRSIAQWTVSGMNSTYLWPDNAGPPPGRLKRHIAFTHANSYYGQKADPARWWTEPNATYDDASAILFFQVPQALKTGFEGFVIKGFVGDTSPANELFYLAFEELTWHPDSTPERFLDTRLSRAYGGSARASVYLKMLRNTTRVPSEILSDKARADAEAVATAGDPRVARRWRNLASELARRASIAETPTKTETK